MDNVILGVILGMSIIGILLVYGLCLLWLTSGGDDDNNGDHNAS